MSISASSGPTALPPARVTRCPDAGGTNVPPVAPGRPDKILSAMLESHAPSAARQTRSPNDGDGPRPGAAGARRRPVNGLGPYAPLLRLALAFGVVVGFTYGLTVLLALALRLPLGPTWLAVVQVHG